ncbi:hypothetical protein EXIGLDRAFT_758367 [Exidia glandulosa HHB12029]|uniref:Uncharacterized protein n=1 Tax=Exidia glandulosa HHB12029 TaxID=1314781 RepID=A0A165QTY4_EXIGL|nr:hypothetical protein EXIGLDRAFT_758367 [Exidia glandulosa HHB12029]
MPDSVAHPTHPPTTDHQHRRSLSSGKAHPASPESPESEDQWEAWDEAVFQAAAQAQAQAQMANTSSSMGAPFTTQVLEEPGPSRARRPLPPTPTQTSITPARPQHPEVGAGAPPRPAATPKRRTARPAGHDARAPAASHLRRRGTLFATDVPVPEDYEAPPPFYAIATDRPAYPGAPSPGTRRVTFESPPPSPLASSFQGRSPYGSSPFDGHTSPYYGTPTASSRPSEAFPPHTQQFSPGPARPIGPSPAYSSAASSGRRLSQNEKLPYDPAAFYSTPVSAHLSSAPRTLNRMPSSVSLGGQSHYSGTASASRPLPPGHPR